MKKSRFTAEQIAYALRHAEAGTPGGDDAQSLVIARCHPASRITSVH